MNRNNSTLPSQLLRWVPLALVVVLFLYGMFLRNTVPQVAEESAEVTKAASYLESTDSLKTLINTLDRQIHYAELEWNFTLNMLLLALFIVAALAVAFWANAQQLKRRLEQLQQQDQEDEY